MDLSQALEIAGCTDAGLVRTHNEDSIALDAVTGLVVLADGMGGYNAGEVASGMATAIISAEVQRVLSAPAHDAEAGAARLVTARRLLLEQIERANSAIYQASQVQVQYAGMGTTLVAAIFHDNRLTVAHIGDSRLYRLRDGQFDQLTRDHSLLQEQIDNGTLTAEQARFSRNKNLVTRALGIEPEVEPEMDEFATAAGDIYLLCSDGLNDMVSDADIAMTLQTLSTDMHQAAEQLVRLANDNGGRDNISAILVKVRHDYAVAPGWRGRLFGWIK